MFSLLLKELTFDFYYYQLPLCNDIVVTAEEENEIGVLLNHLDKNTKRYKTENGQDKTKVMTEIQMASKERSRKRDKARSSGELQVPGIKVKKKR